MFHLEGKKERRGSEREKTRNDITDKGMIKENPGYYINFQDRNKLAQSLNWTPYRGHFASCLPRRMAQWGRITLWDAAADGDVEMVKKRLKMELAKINAQDPQGKTALHEACRWNHGAVAQLLIDEGADPDLADNEGATPLHVSARFGQLDAIHVLVKNGANINAQDWSGNTPLHAGSKVTTIGGPI